MGWRGSPDATRAPIQRGRRRWERGSGTANRRCEPQGSTLSPVFHCRLAGKDRTDKADTSRRGGLFQIRESRTRHSVSRRRQVFLRKNMTNDSAKPIKQADSDRPKPIDILADYRYWRSKQEDRIGTHSPECHVWPRHERCMIHRLARELERTRAALVAVAMQDGTLSVSDGRLFVDVDGVEELAFDYTPPTQPTPGECRTPNERT